MVVIHYKQYDIYTRLTYYKNVSDSKYRTIRVYEDDAKRLEENSHKGEDFAEIIHTLIVKVLKK